jgi:hypothetical protein
MIKFKSLLAEDYTVAIQDDQALKSGQMIEIMPYFAKNMANVFLT